MSQPNMSAPTPLAAPRSARRSGPRASTPRSPWPGCSACVFVRFCEDNDLIEDPLLGGPGIRGQIALDHRAAHLQANPAHDDRHWLREVFSRLRALPATGEIFGAHNPVWADGLLALRRRRPQAPRGADPTRPGYGRTAPRLH